MIFHANKGQVNYGETIGILMLDTHVPFIPGDIGNATTFPYPVKYKKVNGLTVQKMYEEKVDVLPLLIEAGKELIQEGGVKAITGNCGYFVLFQKELANNLSVPVFMSSLMQLSLLEKMINTPHHKIGIITAESYRLSTDFLHAVDTNPENVHIMGLEDKPHFAEVAIQEMGFLNTTILEEEVVEAALELVHNHPEIAMFVLECSILSPYSKALQERVQRPVFDYITLTNFVFDAFVKKETPRFHF
ncbi:hypothetical protein HNR44_002483 [Geomicrobium halophilum]|uniref:Aspartate/glutamate racemase n=1 Tax=Geomicrobium halophilum TaxID=549000 RepID=A0A841PP05_9BACL|nr:aspartate/glutamate racemase family protein [Geomicrobium halophilum]MBB6450500.1 hypothetical protein [Geomicrobium halophilum]